MFKIPFLPAFICLVAITILSTSPGVPMPKFNLFSMDKVGHAAAYALLAWLLFQGFKAAKHEAGTWKAALLAFCLATGYGAFMEFVQATFFPYRFFELDDMLANGAGALATTIGVVVQNRKNAP